MYFTVKENVYLYGIDGGPLPILFSAGDTLKGGIVTRTLPLSDQLYTSATDGLSGATQGIEVYPSYVNTNEEYIDTKFFVPLTKLQAITGKPKKKQRITIPLWAIVLIIILIVVIVKGIGYR